MAAEPRESKAAPSHSPRDFAARIHSPLSKFYLAREQSRQLRRLVNAQKILVVTVKKSHLKVSGGLKSQQTLTAWPFYQGYFRSVDLEMGVWVRLREVSAYKRCPLTRGVRLREA